METTISICEKYDPSFQKFREPGCEELTLEFRIRKIYSNFFNEHGFKLKAKQILRVLDSQLTSSSPSMLLGWLSEWSKSLILEAINNSVTDQYIRHDEELKKCGEQLRHSLNESPKKANINPLSLSTKKLPDLPHEVILTNKESVYSYFLDELTCNYKVFPYDLDWNFLKSIKKQGRKEDLLKSENIEEAVKILIEAKHRIIKKEIKDYYNSYFAKFPENKNKK